MYTFKITKDYWIASRPWYAEVSGPNKFYIKAGGFKTKKRAKEQIEIWEGMVAMIAEVTGNA